MTISFHPAAPDDLSRLVAVDAAACALFAAVGVNIDLPKDHPFVAAEAQRWGLALGAGQVLGAYASEGRGEQLVGFAVVGELDGQPYLEQISVSPAFMRRGIGSQLLTRVMATTGKSPWWLTTYAHVAWNAPYYCRFGFEVVGDEDCGPELRETLSIQRAVLPHPAQRVAMVRRQ